MREETFVKNLLKYQSVVKGMLTALVGDPAAIEDLFQEAAIVMTRKREHAEEDCRFVAWAREIVLNVVRDFRKKNARRPLRLMDDRALELMASVFEETEDSLWETRREALERCAESLPEKERQLLRRRYQEALPAEKLATLLGTTRGAIDTALYRIRKGLHQCVETRLRGMGLA